MRQCDRLRIIDINMPLYLHDIYAEANIFTVLPSSQSIDLAEAFANVSPEQYDRFYLAKIRPSTIPANHATEESQQILLVGGLGSGKTTLLKYWTIACISDKILPEYLPIFLPLRSLVSLNDIGNPFIWLKHQIINYGLLDEFFDDKGLEQLLNQGQFLLLWDGLDDLPEIYHAEITQKISSFSDLYPKNRAVMGIDNTMETEVDIDYTINLALNLDLALYFANHPVIELACALEPDLHRGLQFLRQKFPDPHKSRENFTKWWQAKGLDWSKKLRNLIVQHRKISQEWRFNENQLNLLRTYHDANKLLIECLNNAEYVSPLVKSQIESTLLLPQGEYSILQY